MAQFSAAQINIIMNDYQSEKDEIRQKIEDKLIIKRPRHEIQYSMLGFSPQFEELKKSITEKIYKIPLHKGILRELQDILESFEYMIKRKKRYFENLIKTGKLSNEDNEAFRQFEYWIKFKTFLKIIIKDYKKKLEELEIEKKENNETSLKRNETMYLIHMLRKNKIILPYLDKKEIAEAFSRITPFSFKQIYDRLSISYENDISNLELNLKNYKNIRNQLELITKELDKEIGFLDKIK